MRSSLTQFTKDEAHRLGFTLVGVTSPGSPPHWSTFEEWLIKGRHAGMTYLSTDRSRKCRADPLLLLPECRSILVLGFQYPRPLPMDTGQEHSLRGRIAAYAWDQDYHFTLPARMRMLVDSLRARLGFSFPFLCYTDSGPVLERDLAFRAGLGWIGRNTCLIHPQHGSYFLLAEILLGIDLEHDIPIERDYCGSCQRCIRACPTSCILPDRTLDSNRCIAYLTIENKTLIPEDMRPTLGNWVFGCDICQMVCPWNRFSGEEIEENRFNSMINGYPDLLAELKLSSQDFNRKYKKTPLMRTRRSRYLRNIIIALANSGFTGDLDQVLKDLMDDKDPLIREHAIWAVEKCKE